MSCPEWSIGISGSLFLEPCIVLFLDKSCIFKGRE